MSNNPLLNGIQAMTIRLGDVAATEGHSSRSALFAEISRLQTSAEALANLSDAPDPTATPAANAKRLMDAATQLQRQVMTARDNLQRISRDGLQDLERAIAKKVNLMQDAYAPEIRTGFLRLSGPGQQQRLVELATENRGPELAALILAPRSATNLTEEACSRAREMIVSLHAKTEHEQMEGLMDAYLVAFDTTTAIVRFCERFIDPAKRQGIERGEQAASAAVAAFEQAVRA